MKSIIMVCALAFSFMPGSHKAEVKSHSANRFILYYWFDTSGNYLRQNILLDEEFLTGYNDNTGNPKTLQEKGFNPSDCSGSPPVPNNFNLPDESLYSHP